MSIGYHNINKKNASEITKLIIILHVQIIHFDLSPKRCRPFLNHHLQLLVKSPETSIFLTLPPPHLSDVTLCFD